MLASGNINQTPLLLSDVVVIELVNALYQREVVRLAKLPNASALALQKTLSSLPHYIDRAARLLLATDNPLQLDTCNGSWLAKQPKQIASSWCDELACQAFYHSHGQLGLVVPVLVELQGIQAIYLDSLDEIAGQTLHCNQFGWFSLAGQPVPESDLDSQPSTRQLLKPQKSLFVSACCGHQWINRHPTLPRLLSLREMLLATQISWKNFAKTLPARRI